MLEKLLLYVNTIKYLKISQIYFRILRKIYSPQLRKTEKITILPRAYNWREQILYNEKIDENFKAAIFSGKALEAELETKETELFPGLRANVTGVRPLVDASSNVVIKTRDKLSDSVTSSSSSTINTTGIAPVRQSGRYFRANVKIPAESIWTHAQGIDLTASQGGSR